jgi:hypothetical protein
MIGEHTFELATGLLGMDPETVAELSGEGVLA